MEGCREVNGQKKMNSAAQEKFRNLAKIRRLQNFATWKFHTASKTPCLLQHYKNREQKIMRKHNC